MTAGGGEYRLIDFVAEGYGQEEKGCPAELNCRGLVKMRS
jgi:hypothetical protein